MRETKPSANGKESNGHGWRVRSKLPSKFRSIAAYVLLGAGAFAFIEAFSTLAPILLSVLLTFFISFAINPLVTRMRAFMGSRKIATLCIAAAVLIVVAGALLAFFGPMRSSVTTLSTELPEYWAHLRKPLVKMEQQAAVSEAKLQQEVANETAGTNATNNAVSSTTSNAPAASPPQIARNSGPSGEGTARPSSGKSETAIRALQPSPPASSERPPSSIGSSLGQTLQSVAEKFSAVAVNAAQIMLVLITVFFGVLFTLMNPRAVLRAIFAFVPERHHAQAVTIVKRIGDFLPNWGLATLVAMVTVGLLVFFLMWPLLGFPTALILGMIAATFEAIPYLGPLLSAVPAVLFALSKGGLTPVWVALAYLAVQLLENNVIIPQIMARGMKLHPVAVIFAILLCAAAFGVLGVLVAAPLVAVIQIFHEELYRKRFLPTVTDGKLDQMARHALGDREAIVR